MKLKFTVLLFFVFSQLVNVLFAQNKSVKLFDFNKNVSSKILSSFEKQLKNYKFLKFDQKEFRNLLKNNSNKFNIKIPLLEGDEIEVELEKFNILKKDARIIEKGLNSERQIDLTGKFFSFKGKVLNEENSLVSISIYDDHVRGLIIKKNETYIIANIKSGNNKISKDLVLYKSDDMLVENEFICGTEKFGVPEKIQKLMSNLAVKATEGSSDFLEAYIAIDIDYASYISYGNSVEDVTAYALSLLSTVSTIYINEINVQLSIPYLRVWTTEDPYTGDDSEEILNNFRAYWNANERSVSRTIAHLISLRSGGLGGIAWVDVLCASVNTGKGYAFSNTDDYIGQLPTYSWDVMVVSHELGHNFGSPHTHYCYWDGGPIDTCYTPEGGCYSGAIHATKGTIMSYCHLTSSGIDLSLGFGPQPRELIRTESENASCLGTLSTPILLTFPNGDEIIKTSENTYIYWGGTFTGNVNLQFTSNSGESWEDIANNIPATDREYKWLVPNFENIEEAKVRILNSIDTTQGDTSDAPFSIKIKLNQFSCVDPTTYERIFISPSDTSNSVNFVWTRTSTQASIKYKVIFKKVGVATEYYFSSNNLGSDTMLTFRVSELDTIAQQLGLAGDTVQCTWKVRAYSEQDSLTTNAVLITLTRNTVDINPLPQFIPDKFFLYDNYPNPFNPGTNIKFEIAKKEKVRIAIYNVLGEKIFQLVDKELSPGVYETYWNASGNTSGIYYIKMEAGDFVDLKKVVLLK